MKKVFIIDGASGCGKTSIALGLEKISKNIKYIRTSTTRQRRIGEANGKEHFFLSKKDFESKKNNNDFVGYCELYFAEYGIDKNDILNSNVDRIIIILHSQEDTIKKDIENLNIECKSVLIIPDNEEILKDRLVKRDRKIKSEELKVRLPKYKKFLKLKGNFDYTILNKEGELNDTINKVLKIIED